MVTRKEVYAAIDSERDYQDERSRGADGITENPHEVESFILYMEDYLAEARRLVSRTWGAENADYVTEVIRKVTALGVACMEQHGAPRREVV